MPFSELMRDVIKVRKKDGSAKGPYRCSVQANKIHVMGGDTDVEVGDCIERELPNRKVETYAVLEVEFHKGLHMIPDSWMLHVQKDASLRPMGGQTTNIHIANAQAVQIGNHNVQQLSSVLHSLVQAIDHSDANAQQKSEAKSKLAEFLTHPAVTATLGASAGAIIRSILGG